MLGRGPVIALMAALLLCFGINIVNLGNVVDHKGPVLSDPDSCYHLYIITRTLDNFPCVPNFDPGMVYPQGLNSPWPPLFDLAAASFVLPVKIAAGSLAAQKALVLFMPLLAAFAVIPIFLIARRWENPLLTASAIGFYILLSPAHGTMAGYLDHDGALILFNPIVALAFIHTLEKGKPWWLGLALGALMLTWNGSAIYLVPLGLVTLWLYFTGQAENRTPAVGQGLILGGAIYFVGLVLWGAKDLFRPSFVFPGIYQAEQLWVFGLGLLMLRGKRPRGQELLLSAAVCLAGLLMLPGMWSTTIGGLGFFSTQTDWLKSITENRPLLGSEELPLKMEMISLFSKTGLLLLLAPVSLALWLRRKRDALSLLVGITIVVFALYSLRQIRFLPQLVPWLALGGGMLVASLTEKLSAKRKLAAAVVLVLLILIPSVKSIGRSPATGGPSYNRAVTMAARWFAENHSEQPGALMVPSYFGFSLHCYTGRPVVTDGFVVEVPSSGLLDTARFYTSDSAEDALEILDRRGVRYVFAIRPEYELDHDARVLQMQPGELFEYLDNSDGPGMIKPLDPFYKTMAARLYHRKWNRNSVGPPSELKLIHPIGAEDIDTNVYSLPLIIYEYEP